MTDQNDDRNIIRLPSYNLNKFKELVEKLNRRGAKIGCAAVTYEILKEEHIVDPKYCDPDGRWKEIVDQLPKLPIYTVEIKGEGPKIQGWKFIGTLDHISIPGKVIVKAVPGETVPVQFHNAEPICEHCDTKRIRNETFVLQEVETGNFKLVGRQCVRDFIGYDTRTIFTYLTYFEKLLEEFIDDEEGWFEGCGGPRFYTVDSDQVLEATAAIIHKHGWLSRSKAEFDDKPATADIVIDVFFGPKYGTSAHDEWLRWKENLDLDNDKWKEEAKAAREWLATQEDKNEYMHNLHILADVEDIPVPMFGYWCSLVSSYQRAMERLREKEQQKRLNEWVGEVKKRQDFRVKLVGRNAYDSFYGTSYRLKFVDEDGRTLIWWASNDPDLHIDEEYTIKATVKKHEEYEGWKQTIITRAKVQQ